MINIEPANAEDAPYTEEQLRNAPACVYLLYKCRLCAKVFALKDDGEPMLLSSPHYCEEGTEGLADFVGTRRT